MSTDWSALVRLPPAEVLLHARSLIYDPSAWTSYARARDEQGCPVSPVHPRARQWSLNGAIGRCSNEWGVTPPPILRVLDGIVFEWGATSQWWLDVGVPAEAAFQLPQFWDSCDDFNDMYNHEAVLSLLLEGAQRFLVKECLNAGNRR